MGGFTFILLCIGLVFSIKLLLRKRQNRKVKEQNWDLLQDSEYAPSGFPDTKLRHSLFDSSFTIAVQEAAKIPETPKSASPDFSFGNEKPEKR